MDLTIADLSDECRFTYQQISSIVEFKNLGDKILLSLFILDSSGNGFLSIRKILGAFRMDGVSISAEEAKSITLALTADEKKNYCYLEMMALLIGEEAVSNFVLKVIGRNPASFSNDIKKRFGVKKEKTAPSNASECKNRRLKSQKSKVITIPEILASIKFWSKRQTM